tara:strand:+ start:79 stop:363 length:285 start_codon:yes stop_codon:yes gene_type:complete
MYRRKACNLVVKPRGKNDTQERMIRRFMKKMKKERIIEEYRDTLYFKKNSEKRRIATKRREKKLDKLRAEERLTDTLYDNRVVMNKKKTRKRRK